MFFCLDNGVHLTILVKSLQRAMTFVIWNRIGMRSEHRKVCS